ncbi:MAG: hypothetical protein R3C55_08535 [Parvularculaceae bacterium]
MAQTFDLILKNGLVVNHDREGVRDVGVKGGKIAEIGSLSGASAGEVIDCAGLHVLPGRHRYAGPFPRTGADP